MNTTDLTRLEDECPILVMEDQQQHVEDTLKKVGAIRHGKLVSVYWNELTEEEQRAARANLFRLYC